MDIAGCKYFCAFIICPASGASLIKSAVLPEPLVAPGRYKSLRWFLSSLSSTTFKRFILAVPNNLGAALETSASASVAPKNSKTGLKAASAITMDSPK